jgi:hypothetical protein
MKFVHSLQGATALHAAVDEVVPPKGLISEDLIQIVGNAYNFSVSPSIPKGILPALMMPYIFQSGSATFEDGKLPVYQLVILQEGDIVNSSTTDAADKILADYMNRLDAELGYRFGQSQTKRISHQSHVVVDFETDIGRKIDALGKIEALLEGELHTPSAPFKLKRLAFGSGPALPQGKPITLEAFDGLDFLIERRITQVEVENRYYSSAPTTTSEHLRILERIERELK